MKLKVYALAICFTVTAAGATTAGSAALGSRPSGPAPGPPRSRRPSRRRRATTASRSELEPLPSPTSIDRPGPVGSGRSSSPKRAPAARRLGVTGAAGGPQLRPASSCTCRADDLHQLSVPVLGCIQTLGVVNLASPLFHGCYDWHSGVHAYYALYDIARHTGNDIFSLLLTTTFAPELVNPELQYAIRSRPSQLG